MSKTIQYNICNTFAIFIQAVEDGTTEAGGGEDEKKRQKRGGKGMLKTKKKEDVPKLVTVSRAPRGKKKSVTVVTGLSTFGTYHIWNLFNCILKLLFMNVCFLL